VQIWWHLGVLCVEPIVACGLCYGWVVPLVYLWVCLGLWFTFVHSYWVYGVFFWCIATRVLIRVRGLCTGFVCRAGSHQGYRFNLVLWAVARRF